MAGQSKATMGGFFIWLLRGLCWWVTTGVCPWSGTPPHIGQCSSSFKRHGHSRYEQRGFILLVDRQQEPLKECVHEVLQSEVPGVHSLTRDRAGLA